MEDYLATHRSAATRLPIAVEFEKLFPGHTDHFISQYGFNRNGGDRTNTWNSEAYFDGRYALTMQTEVVVDYQNHTVKSSGESPFYLVEHYFICPDLSSREREVAKFGKAEWEKLYASGGDFSVIGVHIVKDQPVANFDAMAQTWRRPRIPVTLLDEKASGQSKEPATNEKDDDGAKQ